MSYDLLYEGPSPPDKMPETAIGKVTESECQQKFTAGRLLDNNYSIIIRCEGVAKYWAPPPKPSDPPAPATTKQQILDQVAVLKALADSLP